MTGTLPPYWSRSKLEDDRARAIELFRDARLREPLERYQDFFNEARAAVEELLELTTDLRDPDPLVADITQALELDDTWELAQKLRALRYIAGPPLSADDLAVLAEAEEYTPEYFARFPGSLERAIAIVRDNHDRERFPWLLPDYTEPEDVQKKIAIHATAALMATSSNAHARRNDDVSVPLADFSRRLTALGYSQVSRSRITSREMLPAPGEFSRRSHIKPEDSAGRQKPENAMATFVIRRSDSHAVVLLSRTSSSYRNSQKRLVNEVAKRRELWLNTLGAETTVGVLLNGVFAIKQLEVAQDNGLHLWWFHSLEPLLHYIGPPSGYATSQAGAADRLVV